MTSMVSRLFSLSEANINYEACRLGFSGVRGEVKSNLVKGHDRAGLLNSTGAFGKYVKNITTPGECPAHRHVHPLHVSNTLPRA